MVKSQNKIIGVIGILLMLCTSSLSVTYSFAEIDDSQVYKNKQNNPNIEKNSKKERLEVILTEKIVNGKLEVQHYALPDNITKWHIQRMLSFEGQILGWAYVNYNAYDSGIVLFDGKASKIGENFWGILPINGINLEEKQLDLELSEKSTGYHVVMHKTALDMDYSYQIIFSGKVAETYDEYVFSIYWMNLGLNSEIGQNIKLLSIGEMIITDLEKSIESNQEFRNSIFLK